MNFKKTSIDYLITHSMEKLWKLIDKEQNLNLLRGLY